jgi:polysaccharide biosynthesis/export protein
LAKSFFPKSFEKGGVVMFYFQKKRFSFLVMLLGIGVGSIGVAAAKAQTPKAEKSGDATATPPRELTMQPLPVYRINPPDMIAIEMLKMVPHSPYRIVVYDVLQIRSAFALPEQPINDFYIVEASGEVNLGPSYGSIKVDGMTLGEARQVILKQLADILTKPEISVQLAKTAGTQPVTGQYLVATDGRINMRQYGTILISGKTIAEARQAIEKHLTKFFISPEVSVDVLGYNSQVYYVITDGAGMGDNVRRMPITGNETVLDAIGAVGGLSQFSSKNIWIARPSAANAKNGTILPVDYTAITQHGATATNYQIMPGDRIFIEGDSTIALNNNLGKKTAPIERTLGILSLESSTFDARRIKDQSPTDKDSAKMPQKKDSKADKLESELSDALYNYLQSLIPLLERP